MLSRFSILTKVVAIILLVSSATVAVALVGYDGLTGIAAATREVDATALDMREAGRLNAAAIDLSRTEYRLAAYPDTADALAPRIAASLEEMGRELAALQAHATAEQAALLEEIEGQLARYRDHLQDTLALARAKAGSVALDEGQREILAAVRAHDADVAALHESLERYEDYTERRGVEITHRAERLAATHVEALVAVALLGTLLGVALGFGVAKLGIVDPIGRITDALERLAGGDLESAIPETARGDEVGSIARTTLTFQENLKRTRALEAEAEAQKREAAEQRRRDMLALADRFDSQVGAVLRAVTDSAAELQETARQLSGAVEEASAQSTTVAAAAEEASANVRTVASAAEELSSSIAEVNGQVAGAARVSRQASDGALSAQDEIGELGRAIELVEAVIAGINDVAEQTNLLALNATIEAARAGDAGKGFAVVAHEVKALATQTKSMTDEVRSKVDSVRLTSGNAIAAMKRIIEQVRSIDEATAAMAAAVEQQSVATGDISRNAAEASNGTTEVSSSIAGVEAATEQTRAATDVVGRSAAGLAEQARRLQEAVGGFLGEVRAA